LPAPESDGNADPDYGAFGYAGVSREAIARGKVLGHKVKAGWDDFAWLNEGSFVQVDTPNGWIRKTAHGYRYKMEFRIPR
jgi:hypothetical protein